jgi:hypothetical protein
LASRNDVSDDTVRQYLSAAVALLRTTFALDVPIFDSMGNTTRSDKLHPYLAEILASRRNWKKPQPKKEPLSGGALDSMLSLAHAAELSNKRGWLSRDSVLYDFCVFSLFTGSRLAEYGQSGLPKGSPSDGWNTIPDSPDVPTEWRGMPMAFIASDFSYFDKQHRIVTHLDALANPSRVRQVHIRFRYDKSSFNFTIRKFRTVSGHHLCPVKSSLRILERAYIGKLVTPSSEPLGMFLGDNGQRYSIRGHHVAKFLQHATLMAHPDPSHYMHKNAHRIVAHSLRVSACVALHNAGVSLDDITFRLRWNSDAVKAYIRDCARTIDELTGRVISGAYTGYG